MAYTNDPRGVISFDGINEHMTTFKSTGLSANDAPTGGNPSNLGTAVVMSSNQTVGKGSAGNRLFGQVARYESDGKVSVIDQGYATFNYTGTAPVVGTAVEVDGSGNVRAATSTNIGAGNVVVSVDTTTLTCVVKIN